MRTQECQKCVAGTYSLGTGVAFDEWDSLPTGFISHGIDVNFGDTYTNCSKWVSHLYVKWELLQNLLKIQDQVDGWTLQHSLNCNCMHIMFNSKCKSAWRVTTLSYLNLDSNEEQTFVEICFYGNPLHVFFFFAFA